jgi:chromosome partitioning protein
MTSDDGNDVNLGITRKRWMHPSFLSFSSFHSIKIHLSWMHPSSRRGGTQGRLATFQPIIRGDKMAELTNVLNYRRIADVVRAAQRVAIEHENAPDKRKRLRTFSLQEAAALIGMPLHDVTAHRKDARAATSRRRMTFEELGSLRQSLYATRGEIRLLPARRHELGEELATVVFSNFKGGSAKTTSSVHFAQYMALRGYRILLVDLDSQGSATAQFGIDPSTEVGEGNSFATWLAARDADEPLDPASLCQMTYWPTIDLVPAGAILAEAEERLSRRSATGRVERVLYFEELNAFLAPISHNYDVVVVDTRPDVNMLMTVALHAASGLIVPTRATMTDLASTGEYFAHLATYVADFEDAIGTPLPTKFTRIMITSYDPADRSQEALGKLIREHFGDTVLPGEFLNSRVMGTAGFGKQTLYEYQASTDRAAYNRVLASVNAVNQAIEQDILCWWGRDLDGSIRQTGVQP